MGRVGLQLGSQNSLLSVVVPQAFPGSRGSDLAAIVRRLGEEQDFGLLELEVTGADVVTEVEAEIRRSGVDVVCLGGRALLNAGLSLSASGHERDEAVAFTRRLVDGSARLGAQALLVTSGGDVPDDCRNTARSNLTRSLVEICTHALQYAPGLMVRLEPTDRSIRYRQLIGPTADALAVISQARSYVQNVDLNLDLSHLMQLGEDPLQAIRDATSVCRHVHLANCVLRDNQSPFFGERHPPFAIPGSEVGALQLALVIRSMLDAGYFETPQSIVGIEVFPPADMEPWDVLRRATGEVHAASTLALELTPQEAGVWVERDA